ncbi:MAG: hypothetical protein ACTSU5_12975 [Promethearchaeota archaeon]
MKNKSRKYTIWLLISTALIPVALESSMMTRKASASTSFGVEWHWTPGEVSDWEELESDELGRYKKATINSNGSSVQIVTWYFRDGSYRISWQINVLLLRETGTEWIWINYGDWGSAVLYDDTVDDGFYTTYFDNPANSGPYNANSGPPEEILCDTNFEGIYTAGALKFGKVLKLGSKEYQTSIWYNTSNGGGPVTEYNTTWRITFGTNTTEVKIMNNYTFNPEWEGHGSSADDDFSLCESYQYYFNTPSNENPENAGFYITDFNTSRRLDESYDITTSSGLKFGSISIPANFSVEVDRGSGPVVEEKPIVASRNYLLRYEGEHEREEVYRVSLNGLKCNKSAGEQLLRVWYDPAFEFEHLNGENVGGEGSEGGGEIDIPAYPLQALVVASLSSIVLVTRYGKLNRPGQS